MFKSLAVFMFREVLFNRFMAVLSLHDSLTHCLSLSFQAAPRCFGVMLMPQGFLSLLGLILLLHMHWMVQLSR